MTDPTHSPSYYWVAGDSSRVHVVTNGDIAEVLREQGHLPMATVGIGPVDHPFSIMEWIFPVDIFDSSCAACGRPVTDPVLIIETITDGSLNHATGETNVHIRDAVLSMHLDCLEKEEAGG